MLQSYAEIPADALHILRGFFHILPKTTFTRRRRCRHPPVCVRGVRRSCGEPPVVSHGVRRVRGGSSVTVHSVRPMPGGSVVSSQNSQRLRGVPPVSSQKRRPAPAASPVASHQRRRPRGGILVTLTWVPPTARRLRCIRPPPPAGGGRESLWFDFWFIFSQIFVYANLFSSLPMPGAYPNGPL